MPVLPEHPAYTNPNLMTSILRKVMPGVMLPGDPDKLTKMIYQLFSGGGEKDLPLRIPLGKDVIQSLRKKADELVKGADKVEKYSEDLVHDE